jgi:pyruvate dehydrogenase E1 component alpha subunit
MVGIGAATTDKDSIITSYRDHCTHLVKGGSLLEVRPTSLPKSVLCCLHWRGLLLRGNTQSSRCH